MMKFVCKATLLALLYLGIHTYGQSPVEPVYQGFYISVLGGYNLGMANDKVGFFGRHVVGISDVNNTSGISNPDEVSFSLGKGMNAGLAIGYLFNDKFGAELAVNYLAGSKTTSKQEYSIKGTYRNFDQDISAKMIQVSPLIVMKGKSRDFTPYAKAGAIIGLMPKVTYNEKGYVDEPLPVIGPDIVDLPVPAEPVLTKVTRYETTQEASGKFALGIVGIAGVEYKIKGNMHVFSEFRAIAMPYSPEKANVTRYYVDGNDQLSTLKVSSKETVFKDDPSSVVTPSKPREQEKIKLPFSSIGLNVGFRYSF